MGRQSRCLAALFVVHVCTAAASPGAPRPATADDRSAPVYYQRYPVTGARAVEDLALLRDGRVRVQHFPPVDVSSFEWERNSFNDYSWWMQMQELRFLLPAIESPREDDRRLARAWFMRWYAVHMVPEPAMAMWGEPMTAAYRAMVLVRLLKAEETRAEADPDVLGCLRASIRAHQQDLVRPARSSEMSNHGFIAALGLFETTRVFPDSVAATTALARLRTMTARSVSDAGVEMEHSAAYHFVVLDWLEQMAAYLESLPGPARDTAGSLTQAAARMRRAAYFLQDHGGRIPPIGDTDSLLAGSHSPGVSPDKPDPGGLTLFDPDAGYAIYKGSPSGEDCRYVVFRIPGEQADMRSHAHDDALSVFFSHAGETIFGDSGRYSYSSSPERSFVRSPQAHSVVVPGLAAGDGPAPFRYARPATGPAGREGRAWTASTRVDRTRWTRTVLIPEKKGIVSVEDVLEPEGPGPGDPVALVILWHLGSDVTAVEAGMGEHAWSLVTRAGQRLRLAVEADGSGRSGIESATLVSGARDPLLGWYSPSQDVLRPVTTLVVRVRRDPSVRVVTQIQVDHPGCRDTTR